MEDRRKGSLWQAGKLPEKLRAFLMKKDRLVILLLGGILLLVIAVPVSDGSKSEDSAGTGAGSGTNVSGGSGELGTEEYAAYLEEKLADTLARVEGVGRTSVMVTLESSGEKVVEKDTESGSESVQETDSQGGSRTTESSTSTRSTVYSGADTGASGEPYVTKQLSPAVEGVVVIAEGGDNAVTVQNITEAVQALFEIDTHKIKVMKGN